MKQKRQSTNQFYTQPENDDDSQDSQDTEFHLDFLDKIDKDLEENPLTAEQKASAKVLADRSKLNKLNKSLASKKTFQINKESKTIKKKQKLSRTNSSTTLTSKRNSFIPMSDYYYPNLQNNHQNNVGGTFNNGQYQVYVDH